MPNYTEVITSEELSTLLDANREKLVVVFFGASWCRYCRAIFPKFNELSDSYVDVVFAHVDIDDAFELSKQYSIRSLPTFKFIRYDKSVDSSEAIDTLKGATPQQLEAAVEKYYQETKKGNEDEEETVKVVVHRVQEEKEWSEKVAWSEEGQKKKTGWIKKTVVVVGLVVGLWVGNVGAQLLVQKALA